MGSSHGPRPVPLSAMTSDVPLASVSSLMVLILWGRWSRSRVDILLWKAKVPDKVYPDQGPPHFIQRRVTRRSERPTRIFPWKELWGFPGGLVVKNNPPANAGDTGSVPGPGRSHMPRSSKAHVPRPLSLSSRALEPQLLRPHAAATGACVLRAHTPQQEKPLQREVCTPKPEGSPLATTREKSKQ